MLQPPDELTEQRAFEYKTMIEVVKIWCHDKHTLQPTYALFRFVQLVLTFCNNASTQIQQTQCCDTN